MNAPGLLKHMKTPADDGLVLKLKTLTPLYTGGIGQEGDQIHPSNLLGSVRHFSCLVARALGDAAFEGAVWGNAVQGGAKAKQVSLHWDLSGLKSVRLPGEIRIPKTGGDQSKWWFNTGFEGELGLTVTRRGISAAHWQTLQLALAIQVRHATFGAKDQFGLGVLGWQGAPFKPTALDVNHPWPKAEGFSFMRYASARVELASRPGEKPRLLIKNSLEVALGLRSSLRNALRAKDSDPPAEQERLKSLRHLMLGKLNIAGSAVNVSAAYAASDKGEVEARVTVALKPDSADTRNEIRTRFREALKNAGDSIAASGYKIGDVTWQFGGAHINDKAAWLNQLAGA